MRLRVSILVLSAFASPLAAHAQSTDRDAACEAIEARAASERALLVAPRVHVGTLRVPGGGTAGEAREREGWQLRGSVSWSPWDVLRASRVRSVAEARCAELREGHDVRDRLSRATAVFEVLELSAAAASLDEGLAGIEEHLSLARRRRERELITEANLLDMEAAVLAYRRVMSENRERLASARERAAGLTLEELGSLSETLAAYEASRVRVDEASSRLRRLSATRIELRGGVIPTDTPDYFVGIVLTHSLGAAAQRRREDEALEAASRARRESPAEVIASLERVMRILRARAAARREQHDLLTTERELIHRRISLLEATEGTSSYRFAQAFRLDLRARALDAQLAAVDAGLAAARQVLAEEPDSHDD